MNFLLNAFRMSDEKWHDNRKDDDHPDANRHIEEGGSLVEVIQQGEHCKGDRMTMKIRAFDRTHTGIRGIQWPATLKCLDRISVCVS